MSAEPGLPIGENRLRIAIDQQIKKYGMDQLTNRKIRENLKEEFNVDFSPYKATINRITMDVVQNGVPTQKEEKKSSSDSDSDDVVDAHPGRKKKNEKDRKRSAPRDSDSELLEVGQRRRRAAPAPKKTGERKKKNSSEPNAKRRKVWGINISFNAFTAYCALSEELADLMGKPYCARFDVVKTMWAYFKEHNLMDPKDKRYVIADDKLFKIFKKRRFLAFGMMKELKSHIKVSKELREADRIALEKFAAEDELRRLGSGDIGESHGVDEDNNGSDGKSKNAARADDEDDNENEAEARNGSEDDNDDDSEYSG
uniref:SWIB domain-containing protein n=1 Tax=Syphacia muris TaxID=451379 RepID=A0A0N5AHG7_9BILA